MPKPTPEHDDEPSVMGAGSVVPVDLPEMWRRAYALRLVERGWDERDATDCAAEADVDLSESPLDAADDLLSYLANDE